MSFQHSDNYALGFSLPEDSAGAENFYSFGDFDPAFDAFGKRSNTPTLTTELREIISPDKKLKWKIKKSEVHKCLRFQANACAEVILKTLNLDGDNNARRDLRASIKDSKPIYFPAADGWDKDRFVFALGPKNKIPFLRDHKRIFVVAGTTIALPYNSKKRTYYLRLSEPYEWLEPLGIIKDKLVFYGEPIPPSAKDNEFSLLDGGGSKKSPKKHVLNAKNPFKSPSWKPSAALKAEDALFEEVPPHVAAYSLEQLQEGGRHFVVLSPNSPQQVDEIDLEHSVTAGAFRKSAEDACLAKWGGVIPKEHIKKLFRVESNIMDIHHNKPVSWGGDNEYRTYIDIGFHSYIHRDADTTLRKLCSCLQKFGFDVDSDNLSHLPEDLRDHPQFLDLKRELTEISHVMVEDGKIGIGILWTDESFCVPALLQFEFQYGGIHGPQDKGYAKPGAKLPTYAQ